MGTHALGIPDTSLSGRSTRTALSVRRSNSVPTVAKMLQEKTTVRQESKGQRYVDGQVYGAMRSPAGDWTSADQFRLSSDTKWFLPYRMSADFVFLCVRCTCVPMGSVQSQAAHGLASLGYPAVQR